MNPPDASTLPDQAAIEYTARDDLIERAIRRHDAALRSFLGWKLGQDEMEDALQETYERLLSYRDSEWDELPRALLMRIAETVAIDRARRYAARYGHQHQPLDDTPDLVSAEATPERRAQAQEDIALLQAAVREMPERCRQVFVLSRFRGMDHHQIADALGISRKAVEKHIWRALAICRRRVGQPPQ